MAISEKTVKSVFVNLIFLIGVVLAIIGVLRGTSTAVKFLVFDKYPLNSYEETRCEYELKSRPAMAGEELAEPTAEERLNCENAVERERKLRIVEDVTGSVSFLVVGLFLAFSFKRFIFEDRK